MSGSWEEAALDAERRIMDALEKVSQETGKHFEDIGPGSDSSGRIIFTTCTCETSAVCQVHKQPSQPTTNSAGAQ